MARTTSTSRNAFTLIEVMIAAGIFAIGLVAVAAIFPTAIQLQKQTFQEIRGDEFAKAVKTMVLQRGFDERLLAQRADEDSGTGGDYTDDIVPRFAPPTTLTVVEPATVFSAALAVRGDATPPLNAALGKAAGWSMSDRSAGSLETVYYTNGFGASTAAPADVEVPTPTAAGTSFEYGGRNFFWTPLFIDHDPRVANTATKPAVFNTAGNPDPRSNRAWGAYVFVLRGDAKSNYLRPVTGDVIDYALSTAADVPGITLDVPQDKALTSPPSQVGGGNFLKVPGVVRIAVTPDNGNEFQFVNGVSGPSDPANPIVRVGDVVLAENGITYKVARLLPGATATDSSEGIVVDGFIIDRDAATNPVSEIWAAHPGDSGESSLVRVIQFVHVPGVNNLVR